MALFPNRLGFRAHEQALASEAHDSENAARKALLAAMHHIEAPLEILDLVTAHLAGRMNPEVLRKALAEAERAADRRCSGAHLTNHGPALARVAWAQE